MNQRTRALPAVRALRAVVAAGLVAALLVAVGPPASAAPAPTTGCECPSTGPYVAPAKGRNVDVTADGASPSGRYGVLASNVGAPEGRPNLTVRRASDGATVLSGIQGSQWGFSPDDDRFVVHYVHDGSHHVALYDLTKTGSAALLWSRQGPVTSDRLQFSPTGRFFFYSAVVSGTVRLQLVDTATGAATYQAEFLARSAPGDRFDSYGSASWGFGPRDGAFVFGYLTSPTAARMHLVDLGTGDVTHTQELLDISAWWRFSPCGDALGLVTQSSPEQLTAQVVETATGDVLGSTTSTVVDVAFRATATHHVANVGGTDVQLGANTAGEPCPPPPNQAPTASFSLPDTALFAGAPIAFTDTSTDADGQIAAWQWRFTSSRGSRVQHPTHTYASAGTYQVTLTVTDDDGATASVTRPVTVVANQPPVAGFSWTPDAPGHRQTVTLTDQSTSDDGIASREWKVGPRTFTGASATFTACETVEVQLTVTDLAGQADTETRTIVVTGGQARETTVPAGGSLVDAGREACAGDSIVLPAGTFGAGSGIVLDGVDLTGAGAGETIIEGAAGAPYALLAAGSAVTISDLTVEGAGSAQSPGAGIVAVSALTTVESVEVTGSTGRPGITCTTPGVTTPESAALLVEDSEVHHNTSATSAGGIVAHCGGGVTVRDSEVHHNTGGSVGGISLHAAGARVLGNVVRGNVASSTLGLGVGGVYLGRHSVVAGNLITENVGDGLGAASPEDPRALDVVNNTITRNEGDGVWALTSRPFTLFNNIVTGNDGAEIAAATCTLGNNLLLPEPPQGLFASYPDLHLRAGSPAIDAGSNEAVPDALLRDGDGEDRVVDGNGSGQATVDIGWDEAGAGSAGGTADAPAEPLREEPCDPAYFDEVREVVDVPGAVTSDQSGGGPTPADPVEVTVSGGATEEHDVPVTVGEWYNVNPERTGALALPAERWTAFASWGFQTQRWWGPFEVEVAYDASLIPAWATERNFRAEGWGAPRPCETQVGRCMVSREFNAEGDLVFTLRTDMPSAEFAVDILPTPDAPQWVSTPDAVTSSTSAVFDWSVGDGRIGHYECSLDGAPRQECEDPLHLEGLAEGTHELSVVTATFANPEITSEPVTHTWTVDRTAPAAPAPRVSARTTRAVTVAWPAVSDAHGLAGYRVRVDAGEPATVTGTTYVVDGLGCGQARTVRVAAVDNAGNLSPETSVRATTEACPRPAQCVVPRLKGKTLAQARRALSAADCGLGKVSRAKAPRARVGEVLRHSPAAGKRLQAGTRVSVVVGRR